MSNTLPQPSEAVRRAARWLAETAWTDRPHPVVPALREQFGLTVLEACEAIRESRLIESRLNMARAH